jgi:hypothetical protein
MPAMPAIADEATLTPRAADETPAKLVTTTATLDAGATPRRSRAAPPVPTTRPDLPDPPRAASAADAGAARASPWPWGERQ